MSTTPRPWMVTAATKVCPACSVSKVLDDFDRQRTGPLGRQARCRVCRRSDLIAKREAQGWKPRPNRFRDGEVVLFLNAIMPQEGCVLWPGAKSELGYGRMCLQRRAVLVHRYMYEIHNGPIAAGVLVLHRCDNPPCINPAHLWLGDNAANVSDMLAKRRENPWGRRVTHCPRGHAYSAENTYVFRGGRHCKTCNRRRSMEFSRKKRAATTSVA